ncbi:MAG TPA: hypothetical protein VFC68_06100 [Treponemataceae bacterium]|nr:hypothetical protein [Treponemataceae bacterium]
MNIFNGLRNFIKGITVYALVGPSGTGKSFRAKLIAQKYSIDAIIDDGLLIHDDKIIAGHSAKREKTFLGAVRVAIFDNKQHRDEIAKSLQRIHIKKILVLGTSVKMTNKIATRLQLPTPKKIIRIEDIATKKEIDTAIRSRQVEGKHVIPVPSLQIKRNYPKIFYNSIRVHFQKRKKEIAKNNTKVYEKSVVRPVFSKKGRVSISEAALTQMLMHCVTEFDPDIRIKKLVIKTNAQGYRFIITIDVPFGTHLAGKIHNLQLYIIENIERYTGILIEEASIIIDKISKKKTDKK